SLAYSLGAVNSFLLNTYWTFHFPGRARSREVGRFALTTLAGVVCNNVLLWLLGTLLHPVFVSPVIWANASKLVALGGTVLISYPGMRLWVFVRPVQASPSTRSARCHQRCSLLSTARRYTAGRPGRTCSPPKGGVVMSTASSLRTGITTLYR